MKTVVAVVVGSLFVAAVLWRLAMAWFPARLPTPPATWDLAAHLLMVLSGAVMVVWGAVEWVLRRRQRPASVPPGVVDGATDAAFDEHHLILLTALARDPPRAVDLDAEDDPTSPFTQIELRFAARDLERRGLVFVDTTGGFFVGLTDAGRRTVARRRRERQGTA